MIGVKLSHWKEYKSIYIYILSCTKPIQTKMQCRKNKVSLQIFHYVDQTFAFLRSNVCVSTIKRFHYIITMKTIVKRLPLLQK